uniref:DNA 3'-5' helicase n=2 Tax=Schistocephalus solidus TaxID=70667 RepID=A0A0X3PDM4_SCHSO
MTDQALNLQRLGIPSSAIAVLDSSTPAPTQQKILLDICGEGTEKNKHSTIRILFVTPEKLSKSKRLMNRLEKAHSRGRLARIAIDEVHCVSQWGNDFRPDYKFLHVLKTQFPSIPILGLTATASAEVVLDVQKMLGLPQDNCLVLRSGYNRPNLNYQALFRPGTLTSTYPAIIRLLKTKFAGQSAHCLALDAKTRQLFKLGFSGWIVSWVRRYSSPSKPQRHEFTDCIERLLKFYLSHLLPFSKGHRRLVCGPAAAGYCCRLLPRKR